MLRPSGIGVLIAVAVVTGLVGSACNEVDEAPAPREAIVDPGAGAIRVEAASARMGLLAREVTATGMTSAWRDANLRAEVGGRVLEVTVDNGDLVEAGALLLRIDGSRQRLAVSGASARVEALEHDLELARTEYERKQGLVAKGSLAAAQLDGAKHAVDRAQAALDGAKAELGSARRSSKDAKMSAPIAGVVARRLVDVGDTIGAGAPVLDLVDLSKIRVRVGLVGSEIGRLDQDAQALVTIEDLGGESTLAQFAALAPAADPVTGLFDVEYHLDNPEGRIRGGMVATISLPLHKGGERVLIPRAALTRRAGKLAVFVLTPASDEQREGVGKGLERRVAELREVRVGAYGDLEVEILAGVEPGELLATSAQHALADAVLVEIEPPALANRHASAATPTGAAP
ncbi:Efflux transporter, RND family, MFP subunit, AcrA/E family protein [Enhygromyxa salina]|uniref:Efflux transporter, RND family, MFP subunit, AcrA/E family protein n=1 Tax=Enhygromyxa salina TaxID=215803 RepID=A0A0C1ZZ38_9BACT|nr:efflux RND transporter periplasmic adaptor subunit [Enhygromyxa salina]KIG16503.1 Efflux transporter, RND family, MFP subunit, AcrA/E family protein [Enhygromyxa salina]